VSYGGCFLKNILVWISTLNTKEREVDDEETIKETDLAIPIPHASTSAPGDSSMGSRRRFH
jgi:hypothetical protein